MEKTDKITLKLVDRIQLSNILPSKDTFERLVLREGIIEKTKLKEADVEKHQVKTDATNGSITWTKNEVEYHYEFTYAEKNYIRDTLKALSDNKELLADALNLYKTFV